MSVPTTLLSVGVQDDLCRLGELAYPIEACGALLGVGDGERTPWQIRRIRPACNNAGHDRRSHYSVPPEFQLFAEREARRAGEEVLGYYHSHPDGPAEPSPCDRELAWAGYLYLICSVVRAHTVDLALFALDQQGGPFRRLRVEPDVPCNQSCLEVPAWP